MSKRNKSIIISNTDKLCSKCGGKMVIKGHKPDDVRIQNQKQYFTQWEYCLNCRTQWFNPEFLVINTDRKTDIQEYYENRNNLFDNL
jgi:DNA-directed RNA polymerase subunit RPC12/RpoP